MHPIAHPSARVLLGHGILSPGGIVTSDGGPAPVISGVARPGNTLTSTHDLPWLINGHPFSDGGGEIYKGTSIVLPYYAYTHSELGIEPGYRISQKGSNELVVVPRDTDATAIIANVLAAAGPLAWSYVGNAYASNNKWVFDDFIIGCKADPSPNSGVSNYAAMKVWRLAAPVNLAGFNYCGVGNVPTWTNFVSGDYWFGLGIKGNGTTKSGDLNRLANVDPQNNCSFAVWHSVVPTLNQTRVAISDQAFQGSNNTLMMDTANTKFYRNRQGVGDFSIMDPNNVTGLWGASRHNSTQVHCRYDNQSFVLNNQSGASTATTHHLFARMNNAGNALEHRSDARIAFYCVGEATDLAALDARLTTFFANYRT